MERGVVRQLIVFYIQQQNGVAERRNQILLGMIRSMLEWVGLSKVYWVEAVVTAIYLLNRFFISAVDGQILFEVIWRRKFSFLYLRVFGFSAYVYISEERRLKLEDRVRLFVFVGYGEEVKVYKLFDLFILTAVFVRSVIFKEFVCSVKSYFDYLSDNSERVIYVDLTDMEDLSEFL